MHTKHKPLETTTALAHIALILSGAALLIALTVGAVKFSDAAVGTVNRASATVGNVDALLNSTQKNLNGSFKKVDGVLGQIEGAAKEAKLTATSERKYLSTISKETVATMKHANLSLEDLDSAIKQAGKTVTKLDMETLPTVNTDLISAGIAVNEVHVAVEGLSLKADTVLNDAHALLSDPSLRRTEQSVAAATNIVASDLAPMAGNFWYRLWELFFPGHRRSR
jgi:hypothetical protein